MLGALALVTTLVQPGQTLSGIAASHGISLAAIENANPQISDPNLIYVGQNIKVTGGSSWTPSSGSSAQSSSPSSSSSYSSGSSSSPSSSSGYHIPGVSDATAACIAFKESTNGQASANVFQLQAGYYPGMSLSQQEQVAGQLAATQGVQNAWGQYDGC